MIILGAQNVRPCERTSVKRGVAPIVSAQRGTSGATNGGGGPQAPPTRNSCIARNARPPPTRKAQWSGELAFEDVEEGGCFGGCVCFGRVLAQVGDQVDLVGCGAYQERL